MTSSSPIRPVVASAMARDRRLSGKGDVAGARGGFLLGLGFVSLLVAWTAWKLTSGFGPEQLTRADFGIYLNVLDLAARGVFVLALCAGLSPYLPERLRSVLVIIGQGSLYAYVFHIPFCYGALGREWIGQLSMQEASVGVVLLSLASVAAVYLRRWVKKRSG